MLLIATFWSASSYEELQTLQTVFALVKECLINILQTKRSVQ